MSKEEIKRKGFVIERVSDVGCECGAKEVVAYLSDHYCADTFHDMTDGMKAGSCDTKIKSNLLEGTCPKCERQVNYSQYFVVTD